LREGSVHARPESTKHAVPAKSAYLLGITGKASESMKTTPTADIATASVRFAKVVTVDLLLEFSKL
jgi:hypothetical protein